MCGLDVSFRTLATDLGVGTQCTARLPLRIDPSESSPQEFIGIGIGLDGWTARLAAEGEALERATWRAGALWNGVVFPEAPCSVPEEARLMLSASQCDRLLDRPCAAVLAHCGDRHEPAWIPFEAAFFFPSLAQELTHHSVSTGWAYHETREAAAAQGYREVIERDLQMLFWQGRLGPYMQRPAVNRMRAWAAELAVEVEPAKLRVLQLPVRVAERFGAVAWFTLTLYLSESVPYLSVGSALKPEPRQSFHAALGECMMVRSFQYDQILCARTDAASTDFIAHVLRSCRDPAQRDRVIALADQTGQRDPLSEARLDYRDFPYWMAFFQPPPPVRRGVVAKVWVDGCQPLVPAGFTCGLTKRWLEAWRITSDEWEQWRWHPYP